MEMGDKVAQLVESYYTLCAKYDLEADTVASLKRLQALGHFSKRMADLIADAQYIGGGDVDWRKNGWMDK